MSVEKDRLEEKKPTFKEIFIGVTLDSWVERAKVKGLNEFKNHHASPEEQTLETPFAWRAFREWVKRSLREDADMKIVLEALDDIDKKFTYSEAQDFLMTTEDRKFAWIRMQFRDVEEMKESPLVSELRRTIEGARRVGITDRQLITALRSIGLELERPTSKGLAEAEKEIASLTEEIKMLQREKIIPEWTLYTTEIQRSFEVAFRNYPSEDVYTRLREGRLLLDRAYANDPYVTMWLDARGYTIRDLEDEVMRLRRAVAGVKVPDFSLDVLRMRLEVKGKEAKMPTLLEMETILEGVQKQEKWALERMKIKYGVESVYEFEAEVMKLREEVGDPPKGSNPILLLTEAECPYCRTPLEYVKPTPTTHAYYCPHCAITVTPHSSIGSSPIQGSNPNPQPMERRDRGNWIDTEGTIWSTPPPYSFYMIEVTQVGEPEVIEDYCEGARRDGVDCRIYTDPTYDGRIRAIITGAENVAREIVNTKDYIRTKKKWRQIRRFKEMLEIPRKKPDIRITRALNILREAQL